MAKSISKYLPCEALTLNLAQNVRNHSKGKLKQGEGADTRYVSALDIDYDIPQMIDSVVVARGRIFSPIVVDGDCNNEVLQGNRRTIACHTLKGRLEANDWKEQVKIPDRKTGQGDELKDTYMRSLTDDERKEILDNLKRIPVTVFTGLTQAEKNDLINDHDQKPLSKSESAAAIFKALLEKPGMSLRELYATYYRPLAVLTGSIDKIPQVSQITDLQKRHEFLVGWLNSKVSAIKQCFALGPKFVRGYILTLLKEERKNLPGTLPLTDEEQKEWKELGFDVTDTIVKELYKIKTKVYDKTDSEKDDAQRKEEWDALINKLQNPMEQVDGKGNITQKPRTKKAFQEIIAGHGLEKEKETPAVNLRKTLLYLSGKDKDGNRTINPADNIKELVRLEAVNNAVKKKLDSIKHDKELHHLLVTITTGTEAEVEQAFAPFMKHRKVS